MNSSTSHQRSLMRIIVLFTIQVIITISLTTTTIHSFQFHSFIHHSQLQQQQHRNYDRNIEFHTNKNTRRRKRKRPSSLTFLFMKTKDQNENNKHGNDNFNDNNDNNKNDGSNEKSILVMDEKTMEKKKVRDDKNKQKETETIINDNSNDDEKDDSTIEMVEAELVDTTTATSTPNTSKTTTSTATTTRIQRKELKTVSARYVYDNDLYLTTDDEGRVTARPIQNEKQPQEEEEENDDEKEEEEVVIESKLEDDNHEQITENIKSIIKDDEQKEVEMTNDETIPSSSSKEKEEEEVVDIPLSSTTTSSVSIPITSPLPTPPQAEKKKEEEKHKIIEIPGINLDKIAKTKPMVEDVPKPTISGGFNVVLTHCTADFDSLASAVGLAKLWSTSRSSETSTSSTSASSSSSSSSDNRAFESSSTLPTFVVLPRGAHPSVQRFLALHKHLFPIRSLRSLPSDLSKLHRLGLVDAQRRDRVGPAEILIGNANRVTIVDHHIDGTSDIPEATDYIVDEVGSVSTMVVEQLREYNFELTEAEATLLALGIHADTGSLCFDSTTTRDAEALSWVMKEGASQAAIAEHAQASLSQEQQGVLTNALINTNSTVVHGVTVSTVLLSADGFINGLAAVTQDALELSSSDVFLLAVVYDPKSGGKGKGGKGKRKSDLGVRLQSKLLQAEDEKRKMEKRNNYVMEAEAWKGGERALKLRRLRAAFDKKDIDGSGYLEEGEIFKALAKSGVIASEDAMKSLISQIDTDGDGRIDFDEFVAFSEKAEEIQKQQEELTGKKPCTMIVIGRVKAGVNMKHVNLNRLFQQFGGGGHPKAASCTVRLEDESTAGTILQGIVDELIETGLMQQPTVGDFMTSPVLSAKPTMTETQVEDLFVRYDVRALPVVDDNNDVVGLVTYKEVAAAKQRLWNKEQKRIRQEAKKNASNKNNQNNTNIPEQNVKVVKERKLGSALKGWMKQHVKTVETSMTMAEVEQILIENDVGVIPVVADGTTQLVGMVTRTDLLRQHRYYPSLHYINKGFADSIAARKPIIELRKKLKQFDLEEE